MAARPFSHSAFRQVFRQSVPFRSQQQCLRAVPRQLNQPNRHQCLRRAYASQAGPKGNSTFLGNARDLFRKHPLSMTAATIFILIGSANLVWVNYYYRKYIIGAYHNYPEPVAKKLRRAVFYSNYDLNPTEAVKYYKQALEVAQEEGMDMFSDEVMGIKIMVGSLFEKIGMLPKAIEILEMVRRDNLKWIEVYGDQPEAKKKRAHILKKTIVISVRLGDYYANPAMWDRDAAVEHLVWAVEQVEKEKIRRRNLNITDEDEGEWLSDDEQGASLESLAHAYEGKNQHFLATPLFLKALDLKADKKDCHTVVLMNNLASSLAQQSPRAAAAASEHTALTAPPSKEALVENARLWALKALEIGNAIQGEQRDEECDVGCAVATHNLGEFAEMLGDKGEARRKYEEAVKISRAIGFQDGLDNSSERLRLVKGMQ